MKKAVSLLASFALAFSLFGAPVLSFADEGNDEQPVEATAVATESDEDSYYLGQERDDALAQQLELLEQTTFHAADASNTGSIEVRLTTRVAGAAVIGGLQAVLIQGATPATQRTVATAPFELKTADALDDDGGTARFQGIAPGTYVLRIQGSGFLPYSQSVEVAAGNRSVVTLVDRYVETLDGVSADVTAGRGLLRYGDLNGNGVIDNADALIVLQSIVRVRANSTNKDLLDGEYAQYGMGLTRESNPVVETGRIYDPGIPDPQVVEVASQASESNGTVVGSSESVFSQGIQVVYGASEAIEEETKTDPKPGVDLADEETELPGSSTGSSSSPSEGSSATNIPSGISESKTNAEPIPVGLNAFQMLASLRGSQHAEAKVRTTKDTSNMQTAVASGSEVMLEAGETLADAIDALFSDNGKTMKLKLVDETKSISEENPVQLTINANETPMRAITVAIPSDSPNAPTAGQVIVETGEGVFRYYSFGVGNIQGQTASVFDMRSNLFASAASSRVTYFDNGLSGVAQVNAAGNLITVDLGNQIPVKTITIKVTATSSKKLAEIAQVEFLNGMEDKIPEPDLDIPANLTAVAGNKTISLEWTQQRNVTGYEVEISLNGSAKVIATTKNSTSISSFGGKELVNYTTYTLRARSTNGDWRSPWSAPVTATPQATGKPMAPPAPTAKGNYDSITVSWKKAEDAQTYKVYYKKHGESYGAGIAVPEGQMSLTIPNLELKTTYDVVVSGVNVHGEGPRSPEASATTTPNAVKVPWYKLVNREVMNKELGKTYPNPIEKVEADYNKGGDPLNMVDGSYDTYVSGAKGGYYHGGTVTFTQPFDMDTIVLTGYQGQSLNIYSMVVHAWDASGNEIRPNGKAIGFSVITLNSNTRTIMIRTTSKLEDVKKVRVAYQRSVGTSWSASTIAELAFYDTTLYSDTMALWADAEHTVLRDGVTMADIEALRTEANTPDPETITASNPTGEFHPSRNLILAELDNAEAVCKNQGLRAPMKVDPKLNVNGSQAKRGVGGLNGWQPTGVAVEAGQEIAVYVGKKGETSRAVPLAFYVVQNHPDISSGFTTRLLPSDGSNVKVGFNTFVVPSNLTSMNMERGGNLYVVYDTSANSSDQYTVRVSGGSNVPVLDVHNLTGEARMNAIKAYVQELSTYDPQAEHNKKVTEGGHITHTDKTAYDAQNCIANATDIVMNDMMYSIPVSAVQGSLGTNKAGADLDACAQKLASSVEAMEDMMTLFYQHKGFVKNASDAAKAGYGANNAWPTLHQNIRYVRCSGKVFMYAAGNHIGVQWGSTGLTSIPGVVADANGKYQSGKYFGWGVAHEIGHEINNGAYTYAEVTNNYYAQLAQATDDLANPKTRWGSYDTVYKRVASGAKGAVGGKTGIAMYWQLHLAYDDGYNYKTYDNATDMYNNLIFARMDAYCRNTAAAPQAAVDGHPLTMKGANKDNALMRLACAATQKNLLDFFEAWGLTPDNETRAYAKQWPKETRAIQYQTEALRLYRIGDFSQLSQYGLTAKQAEGAAQNARVTASLDYTPIAGRPNTTSDQTIKVKLTNASTDKEILGYEVLRNGVVIDFLRANDFEGCSGVFTDRSATSYDTINTVNNRVFKYEVRAVDKLLARGELIPAGEVKVSHKNSLDKKKWTATTNLTSENVLPNETHTVTVGTGDNAIVYDAEEYATEDDATANHPVAKVIDNDSSTVFSGTLPEGSTEANARITIDFGETLSVVGLRLHDASLSSGYIVETSSDGETWTTMNLATIAGDDALYFTRDADEYLYGHDAVYLRLTVPGQAGFSVSEIDVLGPQGDDAEFLENGIGILLKDEVLGTNASNETRDIPAGSLVFLGTYKGNPAFNALLLYDQDGKVLGGTASDGAIHAEEVIFAPPVADGAKLGDVKEGFWAYYIKPKYVTDDLLANLKSVKAELYRVDNAHTLEGQRLVADTLSVPMPENLNNIDLSFGQVQTAEVQEPAAQADEQGQAVEVADQQAQQPAGEPIESATVSGYSYDLADMYGTAPTANADQSGAAGTPIYGSAINQSGAAGAPIYGGASSALGTPIYDNATPLASPHHEANRLAKTTMRSLGETFIVVLEDVDVVNVAKSLG